ncbi:TerD family protein [Yinghuangia sp. ASG 101]|uniref:TerD family protein n=1 Tax=Yinghuangia sp. ASG 101 TaxID=2896848 RepID=UPI001E48043E|nr:TerD family protein [Yinghuangia sp. ASG 101]UGQ09813.1 TerD family protein [Yinghuangia sp. ASG 101]
MRTFAMGEKARLADLTAATALRVEVAGEATGSDVAAFCFALDADGRIGADRPPVSADRPASLSSAVALVSGGAANAAFDVDLDAVAPEVHRLLFVVASVGPAIALDAGSVALTAGEEAIAAYLMDPADMKGQRALILGELYRRDGWRFGAVGQGYRDGLDQLVRDYGGDVEAVAASAAEGGGVPGAAASDAETARSPADHGAASDAPAVPGPLAYEGSGDRILRIARPVESGPVVVEITGGGTGNFAVWTLNSSLEHDKLLVNEIGAYRGRVLVDERGTATERLKIESDGPWTVVVRPPAAAPRLAGRASGDGPEVLRWTGPRTVVAMTHAGASNFMVRVYAETPGQAEDPYLASLANTIGSYDGESIIPAGPCLVEIEADGDWTITPESE